MINNLFWRAWFRLRFHLFHRRRFNQLVIEQIAGRPFLVFPTVFNPTLFFTSEFMVKALNENVIPPGCSLLDMGTGSGVGAVFAAQWAGRVVAIDLNPDAVRCARINVLLNTVEERVTVREGNLFAPVRDERFDVVLFNPPFYSGEPTSLLDHAFHGADIMERFAAELSEHLTPDGYGLLVLSSAGEEEAILTILKTAGFHTAIVKQESHPLERLTLYRLALEKEYAQQRSYRPA